MQNSCFNIVFLWFYIEDSFKKGIEEMKKSTFIIDQSWTLWPKLLNSQLIFWKSNFILGMPKFFGLDQKQFSPLNFTFWTMFKKFWHSQNAIGYSEVLDVWKPKLKLKSWMDSKEHAAKGAVEQYFNMSFPADKIND